MLGSDSCQLLSISGMYTMKVSNAHSVKFNTYLIFKGISLNSLKEMDYQAISKVIFKKLSEELPRYLTYHNVAHTKDVIQAAERISISEGINGDELTLMKTAALFHDTGYIFGAKGHEKRSCQLAEEYLPNYGYTRKQINRIKEIIMATQMPQSPKDHLGEILADADLDYLGRDDFSVINDKLHDELKNSGAFRNEIDWNIIQKNFFENHSYFTHSSKMWRNLKKAENLKKIKSKLK